MSARDVDVLDQRLRQAGDRWRGSQPSELAVGSIREILSAHRGPRTSGRRWLLPAIAAALVVGLVVGTVLLYPRRSQTQASDRLGDPSSTAVVPAAPVAPVAPVSHSAPPASLLTCSASMSNPHPTDDTTTRVIVHTSISGAMVTATAHYKTTDTTHSGIAASNGVAEIAFRISRVTPGSTVTVDLAVTASGANGSCSTAFTPRSAPRTR